MLNNTWNSMPQNQLEQGGKRAKAKGGKWWREGETGTEERREEKGRVTHSLSARVLKKKKKEKKKGIWLEQEKRAS